MKEQDSSVRHPRFAGTGQRLLVVLLFAVFAGLVWLALDGRFDGEIQQVTAWLREHYHAVARWLRANL